MIKLICGEKGAGKTKKILDMANDTAQTSKGSVVFLDKDDSHKLGLSYKVRLNDMSEWRVASDNELVAFIKGMLATNYDITDIFVDGIAKISGHAVEELEGLPPQKIHCSVLAEEAIKAAIEDYQNRKNGKKSSEEIPMV